MVKLYQTESKKPYEESSTPIHVYLLWSLRSHQSPNSPLLVHNDHPINCYHSLILILTSCPSPLATTASPSPLDSCSLTQICSQPTLPRSAPPRLDLVGACCVDTLMILLRRCGIYVCQRRNLGHTPHPPSGPICF